MTEIREALAKDRFSAYREQFYADRQRGVEPGQDSASNPLSGLELHLSRSFWLFN
jgi:hypothetical protein